jgi:indole-3-glycerol phosphate synthase
MKSTPNPTILEEIVAHKRKEVAARQASVSLTELKAHAAPVPGEQRDCFFASLNKPGIRLVAEIKPKSPSAGQLTAKVDLRSIVDVYDRYAAAISVLTDERYFGGSLEALQEVCAQSSLPVLCKEFVIDPYQVYEARRAGASAVLLMVKILPDPLLDQLRQLCLSLGMEPVIEVQNDEELGRALPLMPNVVLINNRDLATFAIDLNTTAALSKSIPAGVAILAASGIDGAEDIAGLRRYTNKFLVGSSLMRAENIEEKIKELCGTC